MKSREAANHRGTEPQRKHYKLIRLCASAPLWSSVAVGAVPSSGRQLVRTLESRVPMTTAEAVPARRAGAQTPPVSGAVALTWPL
jgi:hypothetical protein